MLTILADVLKTATRRNDWDAPDHWSGHPARKTRAQLEREAELRRQRLYRDAWMW